MLGCRIGNFARLYTPGLIEEIGSLVVWLDSQDNSTVLNSSDLPATDNEQITTWKDKSGQNRDFTQISSTNRPTYRTNMLNNKPSVHFPGGALFNLTSTYSINSQRFTIIFIINVPYVHRGPIIGWNSIEAHNEHTFIFDQFSNLWVPHSNAGWIHNGGSISYNTSHILVLRYNNFVFLENYQKTTSQILINNYNNAMNFSFAGGVCLGRRKNDLGFIGHMQEILIYDTDLLNADILRIVAILRDKWL
jgi:hypothetical protein